MPLFLIFQYFPSLKFSLYQKTIQLWNEDNSLFESWCMLEYKLGLHEICIHWILFLWLEYQNILNIITIEIKLFLFLWNQNCAIQKDMINFKGYNEIFLVMLKGRKSNHSNNSRLRKTFSWKPDHTNHFSSQKVILKCYV